MSEIVLHGTKASSKRRQPPAGRLHGARVSIDANHRRPGAKQRVRVPSAAQCSVRDHLSDSRSEQRNDLVDENRLMAKQHLESAPYCWRSSVRTRITSAESAALRASSLALSHPSRDQSSITFTMPAQTTSL